MSETTNIEWATSTGNPWIGCTKVSPGCKNCYAATLDHNRFSRTMGGGTKEKPVSHWGKGAPRFRTKGLWKDAIKWSKAHEEWRNQPCDPKFRPAVDAHPRPRIFPSLCDWLDDEVPIEWLADFLKLIHDTPNLDWLLLTKRPENFFPLLQTIWRCNTYSQFGQWVADWVENNSPTANVWIGTSVEDQQRADERIPELLKIPAKVRFLSVEPLLDLVDLKLSEWAQDSADEKPMNKLTEAGCDISWVIVGGESGPNARPCNVEWVRSIVQQCADAAMSCFVKQLGSNPTSSTGWAGPLRMVKHKKGGDPSEWPADLRVRQFPL